MRRTSAINATRASEARPRRKRKHRAGRRSIPSLLRMQNNSQPTLIALSALPNWIALNALPKHAH